MIRKLGVAGVIAVLLSLVFAGLALALSITVDGDHGIDEWGVGNSETCTIGQPGCSRVVDDPADVTGPVRLDYDIENVHITNDPSNMYFSLDTYAPGDTWLITNFFGGTPRLAICLDIDDNVTTGGTLGQGTCNGATSLSGVDFVVVVSASSTGLPTPPAILRWNGTSFVGNGSGVVGYDQDTDAVTEVGVPLTNLGYVAGSGLCPISNTAQPCSARFGMYYDNGVDASDDSIPASGTVPFQFGCNLGGTPCSPTAITLTSMSANTAAKNTLPLILAGASVVAAVIAVFFIHRRKTA